MNIGKLGKILAPVVVILGIVAVVASSLLMVQSKKFRHRAEILAQGLADTAEVLDSGSGDASKATFTAATADSNKEGGTLAWGEAAKKEVDLTASGNAYSASANSVAELARNVIAQREMIVEQFVKLSNTLQAPPQKRPNAEVLNTLPLEASAFEAFSGFVKARTVRDERAKSAVNNILRKVGAREYTATITDNGELSDSDKGAFEDAAARLSALRANFGEYQKLALELAAALNGSAVEGVTWNTKADRGAFSVTGFNTNDTNMVKRNAASLQDDVKQLKTQLARIDALRGELAAAQAKINENEERIKGLLERIEKNNAVISSYYKQGLGLNLTQESKGVRDNYSELRKDLSGKILSVDAKYGYVVISLTQSDLMNDVLMTVHRGSNLIGILRVVKTGAFNSIAVVENGDIDNMQTGDTLIIGSDILQDKALLGQ